MTTATDTKETLVLSVTEQDEYWAKRTGVKLPLMMALLRSTKTLWSLYPDGLVLESIPPYRACRFPHAACFKREEHPANVLGTWHVELVPTREQEGYSLLQSRVPLQPVREASMSGETYEERAA